MAVLPLMLLWVLLGFSCALNASLDGTWMNDMSYIMTQAGLVRMVGLNKQAVRFCVHVLCMLCVCV
jgi:hypothetical protein